jgi:hypothetical protein
MIVAAWPRSGGTKYCMDLAKQRNMEFVGELRPGFLSEVGAPLSYKKHLHEAKHGDAYSIDQYFEYIANHDKYIILGNDLHWSILQNADVYLFRKSVPNTLLSLANMMCSVLPEQIQDDMKLGMIISTLNTTLESMYVSVRYVETYGLPVLWYEDLYDRAVNTTSLDTFRYGDMIRHTINDRISSTDIIDRVNGLQYV